MKKRWMISIGVVAIAVGIGAAIWVPDYLEIKKAQAVVEKNLNDPDSAIFRNAVVARESIPDKGIEYVYVCGEVNAKNRMGGYVGYNEYVVINGTDFMGFNDVGSVTGRICEDVAKMNKK